MPSVDKSIDVNAPLDRVYSAWADFERFPDFMENVREVRRTGPSSTHWVVEAAGKTMEWDAETTALDPDRIAWKARGDVGQSGVVKFKSLGRRRTRVDVHIDYAIESGVVAAGAKLLGVDDRIVESDLERFKEIVESRPTL